MASKEIHVPDLGDFKNIPVIDLLVKVGDTVAVDTPLVTLETDKATMDVPSTEAGVIEKLHVEKGSRVSAGTLIVTVKTEGAAAPSAAPKAAAPASASAPPKAAEPTPAPAAPAAAASGSTQDVQVPDLGEFKNIPVIELLVKVGDKVEVDTPLVTLETDKATMDVPSTVAGVIEKLHVEKGSRVSAGTVVASVKGQAGAAPAAAPKAAAPASASAPPKAAEPKPAAPAARLAPSVDDTLRLAPALAKTFVAPVNEEAFSKAHASPSVRKFARELGVDLGRVKGTGQKGRITEEDVKAFVKGALSGGGGAAAASGGGALPKIQVPDFSQFGPVEVKPLSRIQKISGPRLHASWVNLPHVTQFDEADITDLEETRKALKSKSESAGIKLTPLAFIVRACVKALQQYPLFNASLDASGENLIYKKYIHVGFAADTPNGLMVPVIRDADRKDIYEIARALSELSEKARTGKLSGAEMQGGTFTISSLGGIGGTAFTPIINAPEVAILGVSRSSMKPVFRDGAFVPRLILPLSLSYDHRVIDGANGARFTNYLAGVLADVRGLTEAVP